LAWRDLQSMATPLASRRPPRRLEGYRSLILFDPERDTERCGALNSSSRCPSHRVRSPWTWPTSCTHRNWCARPRSFPLRRQIGPAVQAPSSGAIFPATQFIVLPDRFFQQVTGGPGASSEAFQAFPDRVISHDILLMDSRPPWGRFVCAILVEPLERRYGAGQQILDASVSACRRISGKPRVNQGDDAAAGCPAGNAAGESTLANKSRACQSSGPSTGGSRAGNSADWSAAMCRMDQDPSLVPAPGIRAHDTQGSEAFSWWTPIWLVGSRNSRPGLSSSSRCHIQSGAHDDHVASRNRSLK